MDEILKKAVREKHPEAKLETCYEAVANGKGADKTELHSFVFDDVYFVDSENLRVYDKSQFTLIENIEDVLLD